MFFDSIQNTEELVVDLKNLVAVAKVYERAMEGNNYTFNAAILMLSSLMIVQGLAY